MFYNLTKSVDETIELKDINMKDDNVYAGYINFDEFEEIYSCFGLSENIIAACENNRESIRSNIDVYDDYSCGYITVIKQALLHEKLDRVAYFIKKNLFLIVKLKDENESTLAMFEAALKKYKDSITLEKIIFAYFERMINGDNKILESMGNRITALEENMINAVPDNMINRQIFQFKKELLTFRDYYEQLIDVGEELQENENHLFSEEDLKYIRLFTGKVNRLLGSVMSLMDMAVQLREVYEATLDINLNSIMKVFTVITTIFLPLTVITGWYGMNFNVMPELQWRYGYPYVIAFGIVIISVCIVYFKKKKLM